MTENNANMSDASGYPTLDGAPSSDEPLGTSAAAEPAAARELIVPGSGEIIDLGADERTLAAAVDMVQDRLKEVQADILGPLNTELLSRLDRRRKWTWRTDVQDGEQFEMKAASPTAGGEAYDGALLEEELTRLVAAGVIDAAAAGEAIKREVTVTFVVPFGNVEQVGPHDVVAQSDLDTLAARLKDVSRIADVAVEVTSAKPSRTPNLRGIAALRKGDGCDEALDRAQIETRPLTRKVAVKRLTVKESRAS